MKKFMLSILIALVALVTVADAANQPKLGSQRWQNLAGWAAVDTVNWSDQGAFSLRDTLVVATADTTTSEIDITGASQVSLWVIASGLNAPTYHQVTYKVQVSPDLGTWIQMATTFSTLIKAATPFADTTVCVLYSPEDSTAASATGGTVKRATGVDEALLKAGKYIRVIAVPYGGTTGDTTIVKAVLRREWPADPK